MKQILDKVRASNARADCSLCRDLSKKLPPTCSMCIRDQGRYMDCFISEQLSILSNRLDLDETLIDALHLETRNGTL